jgi:hypothetical protein
MLERLPQGRRVTRRPRIRGVKGIQAIMTDREVGKNSGLTEELQKQNTGTKRK